MIRSSMTRTVRPMPYLERPYWRARWLTGTSVTVPPTWLASAGMKRCSSPYRCTCCSEVAAIGLERTAVVVQPHVGDIGDEAVGDHGRQLAVEKTVLAVLAPAADDVVPFVDLGHEQRDVVGIVLQIGVHGDDHFAARLVEAGREGRRLPEVAAQAHHLEACILQASSRSMAKLRSLEPSSTMMIS